MARSSSKFTITAHDNIVLVRGTHMLGVRFANSKRKQQADVFVPDEKWMQLAVSAVHAARATTDPTIIKSLSPKEHHLNASIPVGEITLHPLPKDHPDAERKAILRLLIGKNIPMDFHMEKDWLRYALARLPVLDVPLNTSFNSVLMTLGYGS